MKTPIDQIMAWASEQPDIRALLLVGSRAQGDGQADEFADFDLEIYTNAVDQYRELTPDFARQFGDVWVMLDEDRGDGWPEYLALYADGIKLDFAFIDLHELEVMVKTNGLSIVHQRGYRVLYDPDGLAARLPDSVTPPQPEPPTADEFEAIVKRFWFGAVYVAKQIRRRRLWTVQYRDWTMKDDLLTMVEWHARHVRGVDDTFYEGRNIQEWADDGTRVMLRYAFPHFSAGDSWRALRTTMKIFSRLAPEVADAHNISYPAALEDEITTYIDALYDHDSHMGTGELG